MANFYLRNTYNGPNRYVLNDEMQDVTITEEINGNYNLTFTLPYNSPFKQYMDYLHFIYTDFNKQAYRITSVTQNITNPPTIQVECQHCFFDCKHIFIDHIDENIGAYVLDIAGDIFDTNNWYSGTDSLGASDFNLLTNATDIYNHFGAETTTTNILTDMQKVDDSTPYDALKTLIQTVSRGEIAIDNYTFALVDEVGASQPVLDLDVLTNVDTMKITFDSSELFTRAYCIGKDGLTNDTPYVDSLNINVYGVRETVLSYNNITNLDYLTERGNWAFNADNQNRIDIPRITLNAKWLDLSALNPYFHQVHLGQRVKFKLDGNNYAQRVTKIVWKPYEPAETEITIGLVEKDLFYFLNEANPKNSKIDSYKFDSTKEEAEESISIAALSGFELLDAVETNLLPYLCHTDWRYDTATKKFINNGTGNIIPLNTVVEYRPYTTISDYLYNAHYSRYTTAQVYTTTNTEDLIIDGKQVYFVTITGQQNPYTLMTYTNPATIYNTSAGATSETFKVKVVKEVTDIIRAQLRFTRFNTDARPTLSLLSENTTFNIVHDTNGDYQTDLIKSDGNAKNGFSIYRDGINLNQMYTNDYQSAMRPVVVVDTTSDTEIDNAPIGSIILVRT